jgi:hypothetical protein
MGKISYKTIIIISIDIIEIKDKYLRTSARWIKHENDIGPNKRSGAGERWFLDRRGSAAGWVAELWSGADCGA